MIPALDNLQRRIARFSDVVRFGWTQFRTTKGTTGAVNESGKKLYGTQAQRVLAGGRGGKGDDVVRGEKMPAKKAAPVAKPQAAKPAAPSSAPTGDDEFDQLFAKWEAEEKSFKAKKAAPQPGGHEKIKAVLASNISKAPSEPKQLAKAADAAIAQHQQMRKANPLPPAVEQASKKLIAEKMPSFGEKIANAVKGTLGVTGKAASWAVKNTARLVGGTLLAAGGTATILAPWASGPVTGLLFGDGFVKMGVEMYKGSASLFSKLGKFADDDLTGDTGAGQALPMDQVKKLAQQFAAELQAESHKRAGKS